MSQTQSIITRRSSARSTGLRTTRTVCFRVCQHTLPEARATLRRVRATVTNIITSTIVPRCDRIRVVPASGRMRFTTTVPRQSVRTEHEPWTNRKPAVRDENGIRAVPSKNYRRVTHRIRPGSADVKTNKRTINCPTRSRDQQQFFFFLCFCRSSVTHVVSATPTVRGRSFARHSIRDGGGAVVGRRTPNCRVLRTSIGAAITDRSLCATFSAARTVSECGRVRSLSPRRAHHTRCAAATDCSTEDFWRAASSRTRLHINI